ncbi:MAG: acyl-CoA synthetase (AMP-forming)/AMP-acid ligase II, partial [Halorubrum sp. J07HR59]
MTGGQTLRSFFWRAEQLYPDREVVARTSDGPARQRYAEYADRVRQLGNALDAAGISAGDRVGTVCWNTSRHFETYFGVTNSGAQLHTINPLLPTHHIQHIVADAEDRLLFVDPSLAETVAEAATAADADGAFDSVEQFVFMGSSVPDVGLAPATDYESFLADSSTTIDWPALPDDQPAGLCYTSGTTGLPKGVEYTQSMLWSHTMALLTPQAMCIKDTDVVMPVVPMFHVNAWGMPFAATAAGAKQVYPGPS